MNNMKMKKAIWLAITCFLYLPVNAQIVNVETLRFMADSNGFTGQAQASYSYKEDKVTYMNLNGGLHLAYKYNQHNFLNISSLGYSKMDSNEIDNNFFEHFRYNYTFFPEFIGEPNMMR